MNRMRARIEAKGIVTEPVTPSAVLQALQPL